MGRRINQLPTEVSPSGTDMLVGHDGAAAFQVAISTLSTFLGTGDMQSSTYDPNADGVIAVANGGTGATTTSAARTALGLGTADKPQFSGLKLSYGSHVWELTIVGEDGGYPQLQWVRTV